MNRGQGKLKKWSVRCRMPVAAASLALVLSACGEGPGDPKPPISPPRPVTTLGHVITAQMDLAARPVRPPPGEM